MATVRKSPKYKLKVEASDEKLTEVRLTKMLKGTTATVKVSAPTVKLLKGEITSWNPASGRGVAKLAGGPVPFDVAQTKILNKGYVDLHVGRKIEVQAPAAGLAEGFTAFKAL